MVSSELAVQVCWQRNGPTSEAGCVLNFKRNAPCATLPLTSHAIISLAYQLSPCCLRPGSRHISFTATQLTRQLLCVNWRYMRAFTSAHNLLSSAPLSMATPTGIEIGSQQRHVTLHHPVGSSTWKIASILDLGGVATASRKQPRHRRDGFLSVALSDIPLSRIPALAFVFANTRLV